MALGNRLHEIRTLKGQTLRQVSAAVGIDPTQLSKVERCKVGCSDEMKLALARHFDVRVERLFFQEVVDSQATGAAR